MFGDISRKYQTQMFTTKHYKLKYSILNLVTSANSKTLNTDSSAINI